MRANGFEFWKELILKGIFVCSLIAIVQTGWGQTPGMIYENKGITVLDPNGDGYVSATTAGFSTNDDIESEIDYVSIAFKETEPTSDPGPGPNCTFNDIVDTGEEEPIFVNFDGTYIRFRFRLGNTSPNSKGYSIFVDTDQKFGFTGPNKDPNAVSGNPGFEIEIVLETNFGVEVYNVDGTISPVKVVDFNVNPYVTHCQKAIALTTNCGDVDVFYDFYIPFSQITSNFPGITASTPMRFVGATSMNPAAAIGNNAISDFGGIDDSKYGNSFDLLADALVNNATPTPLTTIQGGDPVLDRSACPTVDAVNTSATTITGASTEADGTIITVYVYQSDSTTLRASGVTSVSSNTWSINISSLSPSISLANGNIVKATATASGKGTSIDNCDIKTVSDCSTQTGLTGITISKISGGKGFTIVNSYPSGTIVTWYKSDYSIANDITSGFGTPLYIPNPVTTTSASQTVLFECKTGQCFQNGVYYFTFKEPGKCTSDYLASCLYSVSGTSVTPTITTNPITTTTTSISGTCGNSASTRINLYVDGIFKTSTTVSGTTSWTISGLNLSNYQCSSINVTSSDDSECPVSSITATIRKVASTPVITGSYCIPTATTVSTVSGTYVGTTGDTIKVYDNGSLVGSTVVDAYGQWSKNSLNIAIGHTITAKASKYPCLSLSSASSSITVTTISSNPAGITITGPVIEQSSSVSGTGGRNGDILKLYIDETLIGSTTVPASGNWSISGLASTVLYLGGNLTVTSTTGADCESTQSSTLAVVQCIVPNTGLAVSPANTTICAGNTVNITVTSPEAGIIYQLYNGASTTGSSVLGSGSSITLTSGTLSSSTTLSVRAVKFSPISCYSTLTQTVSVTVNPLPANSLTVSPASASICTGATTTITVANSESGINYELRDVADNSLESSSVSGTGLAAPISIVSDALNTSLTLKVTATNATTNCSADLTLTTAVTVAPCITASINDVASTEGDSGTKNFSFTVTLSQAIGSDYTVNYATYDGSATTADGDYTSASNTLTILAGNTTGTIDITVSGDTKYEINEDFSVVLSSPSTGTLSDDTGLGTITNDDSQPSINIDDVSATEGNNLSFTVSLSNASYQSITVNYATSDGTATTADNDYTAIGSTLITFNAGETTKNVSVSTTADTKYETNETLNVGLSGASNATISDATGVGTITNDDSQPSISIDDVSATEGNNLSFTVSLSNASYQSVTVNYATSDGTATTADNDYTAIGSTLITFNAGETTKNVSVSTTADTKYETNETLNVGLSGASNATISDATGVGTITNDDSQPTVTLSIGNSSIAENAGSTIVTATLSNTSYQDITVNLSFSGTATSGDVDYSISGASITILAGSTTGTITITAVQDVDVEGNETVIVDINTVNNATENGTQQVTTTIADDDSANNFPVAVDDNAAVDEDSNISTDVSTNDTGLGDGGLVVTVTSGPSHGGVSISGTTVTYTPDANYNGSDSYTYQICDVDNDCSSATVNITVNSVNDTPVAADDNATVDEDSNISTDVSTNDTGLGDGGLVVTVTSGPSHGGVSISGTTVTYTPDADYNGSDSYTYQICDVDNDCSSATVNITVNSVNDTPVAADDNATVDEDSNVSTDVSTNDTGLGDGGLVVTVTSGPSHGGVSISGTTVTYTPDPDYNGSDSYTYQICDADGDCSSATVNVTINSVDDIPVAANDNASTMENTSATVNVLSNDTGLGDGGILVSISINPAHGNAIVNGNNTITYTPSNGYLGNDTLTYQVCDADGDCVTAKLIILVDNTDDIPSALDDLVTVNEDGSANIDVLANDTGLNDGGLIVTIPANGKHGTAIVNIDNTITYTPNTDYFGSDTITYQVCDVDNDCSTAQVIITVASIDDLPVAVNDIALVDEDSNVSTDVSTNDTGLGDGGLVVTVTSGPSHGGVSISGTTVTYTPDPDYNGSDSYTYQICDADGDCSSATVNVTINSVDDIPVATNDNASTMENTPVTVNVLSNDTGLGDGGISISIPTNGLHGIAIVNPDGTITYTPNSDYNGSDTITYQVCDGDGDFATAQIIITVVSTNHTPTVIPSVTSVTTTVNTPIEVCFTVSDSDNDTLHVTPIVNHGTLVSSGNTNCFLYTPNTGYFGLDTINITWCDPEGACTNGTVPVTITPLGEKPVIKDDTLHLITTIGKEITGCIEMLTSTDGLTATLLANPENGIVTIQNQLCIKYEPIGDYTGTFNIPVVICNTAGLCDTIIISVEVIPVKIPQGFSPNGDGIDEYFIIDGLDLFEKVSVKFFNRWGNLVYEADVYKNNWDGTSKNAFTLGSSKLPAGTYFYAVDFHNGKKPLLGYVYLSR